MAFILCRFVFIINIAITMNQELLNQLDNLNSFNKKQLFLNNTLRRLGSGSSRIVYEFDDRHVIKLAKNNKGLDQNDHEADVYFGNRDIDSITKIEDYDEKNSSWILAEKAVKLKPSRFKQIKGFSFNDFAAYLTNYFREANYQKYKNFGKIAQDNSIKEIIDEDDLANDLIYLQSNYGLGWGDLVRISSYGEVNRNGDPQIVLVDYGYVMNESINERVKTDGGYGEVAMQPQIVDENKIIKQHRRNIHTPVGVKHNLKLIENELLNHYSNATDSDIESAIEFINKITLRDDDLLDKSLGEIYKNYLIIETNINKIIKIVKNPEEFYNKVMDVQKYLKYVGTIKESKLFDNTLIESFIIDEDNDDVNQYLNDHTLNLLKHVNCNYYTDTDNNDVLITKNYNDVKNYYNQLNKQSNSFPFIIDIFKLNENAYVIKSKPYTISIHKQNILDENFEILKKLIAELFHLTFEQFYLLAYKNNKLFKVYNDIIVDELDELGQTKYLHLEILKIINEITNNQINTFDFLDQKNYSLSEGNLVLNSLKSNIKQIRESKQLNINEAASVDDELVGKIMKKLNINNFKPIGNCGEFGCAYDIGNNKVLKITTDQSEAIESNKIKGKILNNIANIYNIYKTEYNGNSYYIIILEKLRTEPAKFKKFYNDLNIIFRKLFDRVVLDILVDEYQESPGVYIDDFKEKIDGALDKNSEEGKFYYGLTNIIDELKRYNIQSSDYINYKNLGYKPNGNLGFFDVGFGDTSETNPPENLNINERKMSYMPNSQSVQVKKECTIGGNSDGTSKACNQGEINNLVLKPIDESEIKIS